MFRRRGIIIRVVSNTKQYKRQYISVGCADACTALSLRLPEDGTWAPKHVVVLKQIYIYIYAYIINVLFIHQLMH
jgi:hypothetical protein